MCAAHICLKRPYLPCEGFAVHTAYFPLKLWKLHRSGQPIVFQGIRPAQIFRRILMELQSADTDYHACKAEVLRQKRGCGLEKAGIKRADNGIRVKAPMLQQSIII